MKVWWSCTKEYPCCDWSVGGERSATVYVSDRQGCQP